jgi:hypothetical protein
MKRCRVLLVLTTVLFLAWIGWLTFLAATTTEPLVLARPQFLLADLYVVADVVANPASEEPDDIVTVEQVIWSANQADAQHKKILVKNLTRMDAHHGWQGPGQYILPLSRTKESDVFQVTALPRTPGFSGGLGRIYHVTPQTLEQLQQLKQEFHP